MKQVYVARDAAVAELAVRMLQHAGLHAVVREGIVGVPPAPFPSLWVEDSEVEDAEQVLRGLESGRV